MADAPCDISGKCEVSDEDERSGAQEAMCVHCGGWRYRNHPSAGNWGVLDGASGSPRATPPAAVVEALEQALRHADQVSRDLGWHRIYDETGTALAKLEAWRAGK